MDNNLDYNKLSKLQMIIYNNNIRPTKTKQNIQINIPNEKYTTNQRQIHKERSKSNF